MRRLRPTIPPPARLLRGVCISVVLLLGALGGAGLALQSFGDMRVQTTVADIDVEMRPAINGAIELRVALVNWGLRTDELSLPLHVRADVGEIDRAAAREALGPDPAAPSRTVRELRADGVRVAHQVIERAIMCALLGSLFGGLVAGALLGAIVHRRQMLGWGALAGLMLPIMIAMPTASALDDLRALGNGNLDTRYVGRGEELAKVVAFAEQLLYVGDDYTALYERALGSVSNIVRFTDQASGQNSVEPATSWLVASDLHDNVLVLDAFDRFAGARTVFMPGDFGQVGAKIEERLAPKVADLGGRVVAVSGNHDSHSLMTSLVAEGATVLTSTGTLSADGSIDTSQVLVNVDGQMVAGYSDPLERQSNQHGHDLRVRGEAYEAQVAALLTWFDALPQRPDVLLIHQHGFAHRLQEHLANRGDNEPLVLITGHDHVAHVDKNGPRLIVDGGSIGAGGPFAVGEQPVGFAQVLRRGDQIESVDLVTIDPIDGAAAARRVPIARGATRLTAYADHSRSTL